MTVTIGMTTLSVGLITKANDKYSQYIILAFSLWCGLYLNKDSADRSSEKALFSLTVETGLYKN